MILAVPELHTIMVDGMKLICLAKKLDVPRLSALKLHHRISFTES